MGRTYTQGTLLWIDDRFANADMPKALWQEVFGEQNDYLFRLMDLRLWVASNYEDALVALDELKKPEMIGSFVQCLVDLKIPRQAGCEDEMRFGIAIAKEIERRNLPLYFLSAKSDAYEPLHAANLGTVRYYRKQPEHGLWGLPNELSEAILKEFRNQISWISLEDIFDCCDDESNVKRRFNERREAIRHFPFFGSFRDLVERWEERSQVELEETFVVRATTDHSEEFVQQAVLLILQRLLTQVPGHYQVDYGLASDQEHRDFLDRRRNKGRAITITRIDPQKISLEEVRDLLQAAMRRPWISIFVIPNDESGDRYSEILSELRLPVVDELPQTRHGDTGARSELIRRTCAVIFQSWALDPDIGGDLLLPAAYLAHPELLINPIHWTVLHEAKNVARELSDPFEIANELLLAIEDIGKTQYQVIRRAAAQDKHVEYRYLLKVANQTITHSELSENMPVWVSRALDEWLNTSWHFPYGLSKEFSLLEGSDEMPTPAGNEHRQEVWRCRHWEHWEDSAFRILVGILKKYRTHQPDLDQLLDSSGHSADLARVWRFVDALGGEQFLRDDSQVDWEALEHLRWPHHRYPMPGAINRRLKAYGRYLWIQPEGLDLASALPMGRARYRMLADVVEGYHSTLTWLERVGRDLPRGWSSTMRYLALLIRQHRIAEEWARHPQRVGCHLRALLLNGTALTGLVRAMAGGELSKRKPMSPASGDIGRRLEHLGHQPWINGKAHLQPRWAEAAWVDRLAALKDHSAMHDVLRHELDGQFEPRANEAQRALLDLLSGLGSVSTEGKNAPRVSEDVTTQWRTFADAPANHTMRRDGWSADTSPSTRRLLATKGDQLWTLLDGLTLLSGTVFRFRHFHGYELLSAIHALDIDAAGNTEVREPAVVENVFELFVAAAEGLVAQLAWVLKHLGLDEQAASLAPPGVVMIEPKPLRIAAKRLAEHAEAVLTDEGLSLYLAGVGPGSELAFADASTRRVHTRGEDQGPKPVAQGRGKRTRRTA